MNIKRIIAGAVAGAASLAVLSAPAAEAATYVSAVRVYSDANYRGTAGLMDRPDFGDCDYAGYWKELSTYWKNNLSSVGGQLSGGCNYIILYKTTWAGTRGAECYRGYLPVSYVGNNCNDQEWGYNLAHRQ